MCWVVFGKDNGICLESEERIRGKVKYTGKKHKAREMQRETYVGWEKVKYMEMMKGRVENVRSENWTHRKWEGLFYFNKETFRGR